MKRLYLYLAGIFILYFQASFLNSFTFFKTYFEIDFLAIFLYSTYIISEKDILDLILILGILSDLLYNSLLGIHSLVYLVVFVAMKFTISKTNFGNFIKYVFIFIFGLLHSILYSFLVSHLSLMFILEFSIFLPFIVFIFKFKSSSTGWFR